MLRSAPTYKLGLAVFVRFAGPTNTKPARFIVTAPGGRPRKTYSYDYSLDHHERYKKVVHDYIKDVGVTGWTEVAYSHNDTPGIHFVAIFS